MNAFLISEGGFLLLSFVDFFLKYKVNIEMLFFVILSLAHTDA